MREKLQSQPATAASNHQRNQSVLIKYPDSALEQLFCLYSDKPSEHNEGQVQETQEFFEDVWF